MNHVALEAWWVFCGTLVFIMLLGFLLLETGWVDKKHMSGIAAKNVCMFIASSLTYSLWGFYLMYGESFRGLIGMPYTVDPKYDYAAWRFYQTGFAAVCATIISGAIAGRTTLISNVFAAILISGVIYPIHGHWIWHRLGILHEGNASALANVHDYAGSGVVHFVGGIAALVATAFAGRRSESDADDKRVTDKTKDPDKDRNPHLAAAGVLVLVIGWIGFNGGSVIDFDLLVSGEPTEELFLRVGSYVQFTILGAGTGGFAAFLVSAIRNYSEDKDRFLFDAFPVLSGTMAGMVAVSASCNIISEAQVLFIGSAAGVVAVLISWLINWLRLIDPVDAIAVHAGGGATGMLAAGFVSVKCLPGQVFDLIAAFLLCGAVIAGMCLLLNYCSKGRRRHWFIAEGDLQGKGLKFSRFARGYEAINRRTIWVVRAVGGGMIVATIVSAVMVPTVNLVMNVTAVATGVFLAVFKISEYLQDLSKKKRERRDRNGD